MSETLIILKFDEYECVIFSKGDLSVRYEFEEIANLKSCFGLDPCRELANMIIGWDLKGKGITLGGKVVEAKQTITDEEHTRILETIREIHQPRTYTTFW